MMYSLADVDTGRASSSEEQRSTVSKDGRIFPMMGMLAVVEAVAAGEGSSSEEQRSNVPKEGRIFPVVGMLAVIGEGSSSEEQRSNVPRDERLFLKVRAFSAKRGENTGGVDNGG